jgi:hypothetical protein
MRTSVSVSYLPATADVLLLYPGESLADQLGLWSSRHLDRQIETSFERSLPEIRRLLGNTATALIDATQDPSQATDAFLQSITQLGASAVTMYTERMHDDLEMFVRTHGSLFILGPLFEQQWDEWIEPWLRTKDRQSAERLLRQRRQHTDGSNGHARWLRQRFVNRFRTNLDWPFTDSN